MDPSHSIYSFPRWWAARWSPTPTTTTNDLNVWTSSYMPFYGPWDLYLFRMYTQARTLDNQVCIYLIQLKPDAKMPSRIAASVYLHYIKEPGILHFHQHLSVSNVLIFFWWSKRSKWYILLLCCCSFQIIQYLTISWCWLAFEVSFLYIVACS